MQQLYLGMFHAAMIAVVASGCILTRKPSKKLLALRPAMPDESIDFGAIQRVDYGFSISIGGHIDRPSGRMAVTTVTLDPTKPNDPYIAALRYDMMCANNSAF
jgi:hypothetical protein